MPKFMRSLFGQVVLALLVGVAIGLLSPEFAIKLKPLGDAFIKLIKMIIPVLVFSCTASPAPATSNASAGSALRR